MPGRLIPDPPTLEKRTIMFDPDKEELVNAEMFEQGMAELIGLYQEIDNGREARDTLKAWLLGKRYDNAPITYAEMSKILENIQSALGGIHAKFTAARKKGETPHY